MNRLLTLIVSTLLMLSFGFGVNAAEPTIADHINASGTALIFQPAKLNARLEPKAKIVDDEETVEDMKPSASGRVGGYRIQMFSGNNARTSQGQATGRAALVNAQFPEYATYVSFDAPYWRLKVGDFRTYEDASAALARLKASLSDYAREMRIVRDRINIQ